MIIQNWVIKLVEMVPFSLRTRIKNMPGLKQLQSILLSKWINNEAFVAVISGGPAKGLVFPVQMPQDKLMWIGTWEIEFAEALRNAVKPGWVCFDIGGYKGYYGGVMALKGASEVFIFEPMPANATKIKKLIELNASLPIRLQELAISDTCGKAVFKLMPEETMGKLEASSFQREDEEIKKLSVECVTLDELMKRGIPEPDFIKIDVEGAEEFVLKGAVELLQRKRPYLMIEVHSPEIGKRCQAILSNHYSNITVLETGLSPDQGSPEICHYIASV
ncbi:FkbM family methyltransferase [Ferruginibacter paludis]|uniref:FkbM family methyltransferase n=1 Tax=Ferruginibacter paludis TaxID=1310417 RepID=UPI0025B39222|nr:FkbM family methyltransferase [Ferruginibacter paludis]MDN3655858.1 FkbM family methyltransferase [Ferruginibacter paludis]